jgi:hypothetical protein
MVIRPLHVEVGDLVPYLYKNILYYLLIVEIKARGSVYQVVWYLDPRSGRRREIVLSRTTRRFRRDGAELGSILLTSHSEDRL